MANQLSFFTDAGQSAGLPKELLEYIPAVFSGQESALYLQRFIDTIPWEQTPIMMYGKPMLTPRLTAWFGDTGKSYAYTGNRFNPYPWTDDLIAIKKRLEPLAGVVYNSVLLNYYRDGNDSVAWHADDEQELGPQPHIASVSFGQVRRFDIRNKADHQQKYAIKLENGSLLLMKGSLQHEWEHRIPKSTTPMGARINLTFRVIK
ncbi:alkylated DNA repair dioxygenase AlkB [Mucilaginibacter yixingensis]|uniref:Alkylated DNA repair dioxygenase AlkB n=1 Tax=Mucilaginibacter yixingensis TaxID=1295612 RepID=A0A2T5JF62_9SPHI|nr:alpha-ketoglutarate-dependent dioxygenase AlkB [Mucilaginibacter yixingensis]PTR01067.1 alkylated DNA repair dioxygenase AlkB [Mucilaginibacter yixingensis]